MYIDDKVIWGIVIVITLWNIQSSISKSRSEIKRINITLDKIARHIGVPYTVIEIIDDDEFKKLILEDKKIKAIKRYRELTGLGLQPAKKYVDSVFEQRLE